MNENLKTLSDETYIFAEQYSIYSPTLLQCYTEKFAQLIIQECLNVVTATSNESADLGRTVLENSVWINLDVNRYFGIE